MSAYRKPLVLLDLSDGSEQVAGAAAALAGPAGEGLIALHVVEFIPIEPLGESLQPTPQIQDELTRRAGERLTQLLQRLGLTAAGARIETGNTKSTILRVAAEVGADLIVLGSRERHGLAILVNFTEDTVLHAAHCDVLAIRLK
jgi:universal stress protein A